MGLANGISGVEKGFKTDPNLNRARRAAVNGARALPSATSRYLLEKVPIFQWLPNYSIQWLLNDFIAGLTVGALLVPQALAYAKIATIPLQDGLLASWLPSALYFFMGTSKDISVGPTSIIGLLTAEIVKEVSAEGFTPTAIATAISFSVGIYALIMGLFKLGFLLDFISLPVLTGFVGAAGLTILIGQIPAIFGVTVGTGVANQIHDIVAHLPKTKPLTFVMGASAIVMLFAMQYIAKRWGKKNKAIWVMGIGRNVIVLILFTGISYGLNKDLKKPLFDLTSTVPSGLVAPVVPDTSLVAKIFSKSVAVFIAAALEHIAIAKSFARRNGYVINESQELTFLGTTNLLNSMFGGMAVGGAFSRTAVNSESGVKSPLSGLFTTATVIASLYFLTGALFWVPKATLSAVIIAAVWQILVPVSVFYKYWKTSLADFTASQIAFWVTLFVSAETGIEGAAAFMIVITLLRNVFGKVAPVSPKQYETLHPTPTSLTQPKLPAGVALIKYTQALTYLNAYSTKAAILGEIQTNNLGAPRPKVADSERLWSDQGAALITFLRQQAGISSSTLPHLRMAILDFGSVGYIDTTGIQSVIDLKAELVTYGGPTVELRFACVSSNVVSAFERAGWLLAREGGGVYASVIEAVSAPVMTKVVVDGENDMMRKDGSGEKGFEEMDHDYADDAETVVVYRNRYTVSNYPDSDVGGGGKI